MVNKQRDYGLDWERELVRSLKALDSRAARMPNSGAFGTTTGIDSLKGDVRFSIDGLHFLIEAKAGYGGSKSITFQKEWMDKVIEECKGQRPKRIPIVALKMRGARSESGKLIVITLENFIELLKQYDYLLKELLEANDYIMSLKDKGIDIKDYLGVK